MGAAEDMAGWLREYVTIAQKLALTPTQKLTIIYNSNDRGSGHHGNQARTQCRRTHKQNTHMLNNKSNKKLIKRN